MILLPQQLFNATNTHGIINSQEAFEYLSSFWFFISNNYESYKKALSDIEKK